jgi:predicted Zn finger-like uncharacterized protein
MIITCEACGTSFRLKTGMVRETGSKVRCSKCQHVFTVYPPAALKETGTPSAGVEGTATMEFFGALEAEARGAKEGGEAQAPPSSRDAGFAEASADAPEASTAELSLSDLEYEAESEMVSFENLETGPQSASLMDLEDFSEESGERRGGEPDADGGAELDLSDLTAETEPPVEAEPGYAEVDPEEMAAADEGIYDLDDLGGAAAATDELEPAEAETETIDFSDLTKTREDPLDFDADTEGAPLDAEHAAAGEEELAFEETSGLAEDKDFDLFGEPGQEDGGTGLPEPSEAEGDFDAYTVMADSYDLRDFSDSLETGLEEEEEEMLEDFAEDLAAEDEEIEPETEEPEDDELDFSLDLPEEEEASQDEPGGESEEFELDLDLDLDEAVAETGRAEAGQSGAPDAELDAGPVLEEEAAEESISETFDGEDWALDLDEFDLDLETDEADLESSTELDEPEFEFDFDLEEDAEADADRTPASGADTGAALRQTDEDEDVPLSSVEGEGLDSIELDADEFDFDLDLEEEEEESWTPLSEDAEAERGSARPAESSPSSAGKEEAIELDESEFDFDFDEKGDAAQAKEATSPAGDDFELDFDFEEVDEAAAGLEPGRDAEETRPAATDMEAQEQEFDLDLDLEPEESTVAGDETREAEGGRTEKTEEFDLSEIEDFLEEAPAETEAGGESGQMEESTEFELELEAEPGGGTMDADTEPGKETGSEAEEELDLETMLDEKDKWAAAGEDEITLETIDEDEEVPQTEEQTDLGLTGAEEPEVGGIAAATAAEEPPAEPEPEFKRQEKGRGRQIRLVVLILILLGALAAGGIYYFDLQDRIPFLGKLTGKPAATDSAPEEPTAAGTDADDTGGVPAAETPAGEAAEQEPAEASAPGAETEQTGAAAPSSGGPGEAESTADSDAAASGGTAAEKPAAEPAADAGNLQMAMMANPNYRVVSNESAGRLLVISGRVTNRYEEIRSAIKVKANLFDPEGRIIQSSTAFAGSTLSDADLESRGLESLQSQLAGAGGDTAAPGESLPFMVVFGNLPADAEEFNVEVVSSASG